MSRRIFEQTENTDPVLTQRVAFGRAGQAIENMSLTSFITWMQSKLSFLLKSLNLSDLPNKTTARSNLGVYSTAQVDAALLNKANIYPTAGGALRTNNTSSFTPTTDYHPATKKYIDDQLISALNTSFVSSIPLVYSGTTFGYLYLYKIGRSVTGIFQILSERCILRTVTYTVPAALRPIVGTQCWGPSSGYGNSIHIKSSGAINIFIDGVDGDEDDKNVSISYVTA